MKPFTLLSGKPATSEEILADIEAGRERQRIADEKGLPRPRFVDYVGLLKIANNINLPPASDPGSRAYDPELSKAVTKTAQKLLRGLTSP